HAGVIVSGPTLASVFVSSAQVTWNSTNTATGFEVDASTASDFSGVLFSSITANPAATQLMPGDLSPLAPNTTYYTQVGGISGGTTSYINTVPAGLSTLASPLQGPQFYNVSS